MDAPSGAAVGRIFNEARLANETRFDLETIFHAQYKRMCRVIARVLRDPARAEELAVEVFLNPGIRMRTATRLKDGCTARQA